MQQKLLFLGLILVAIPMLGLTQCRLNYEDLKPIISRYNPFFTDHSWDDNEKVEAARLDPWRLLIVRQKGCLRHHVLFTMMIDKEDIYPSNRFWVNETLVMMKRIYFDDAEYLTWKRQFEVEFIKQFLLNGPNVLFNFPVGERTFICKVEVGDWGAKIRMEVVKFIIVEKIKRPGIAREADDGWFKGSE
ncbi:MAG: hypothetical protein H6581_08295 [Bacteroidia bacterium]|nr:hypothetical protein [Bacteroidia bacterium]